MSERTYAVIDLKSFYASVECVERGLDPLAVNLVVADDSRTESTICLAVTPSLKAFGIPGRARLYSVNDEVEKINMRRRLQAPGRQLRGSSWVTAELEADPTLALSFITAPPRMSKYLAVSAQVYEIYLKYFEARDIHVYSVDEAFVDMTTYLDYYACPPRELVQRIILEILQETGVTATAGIGPNLYLCKVALDIEAKKLSPDQNGVRIAELDEMSYREKLWDHKPITDFWRIGKGYAAKLDKYGMETMGDVARCSLEAEETLYRLFGKNAELLIDHAWGHEPCTLEEIQNYHPTAQSMSSGQVLKMAYKANTARMILGEMADALALDLTKAGVMTDQLVVTISYDSENLLGEWEGAPTENCRGHLFPIYGRSRATINLEQYTSSRRILTQAATDTFDRIMDRSLTVRRLNVTATHILPEGKVPTRPRQEQLNFFTDVTQRKEQQNQAQRDARHDNVLQKTTLELRERFGNNVLMHAVDFLEHATQRGRNLQIGGHRA